MGTRAYVAVPFRGDVSDLWPRAKQCTADAVKALSREDQPQVELDSSLWLFTECVTVEAHSPKPTERIASINDQ